MAPNLNRNEIIDDILTPHLTNCRIYKDIDFFSSNRSTIQNTIHRVVNLMLIIDWNKIIESIIHLLTLHHRRRSSHVG